MDRIGLVCRSFLEQEDISQRGLAEILGVSLGSVNKLVSECAKRGFLEAIEDGKAGKARYRLTKAGQEYLAPYRMDGAVIFAAGFGSRFVPLTFEQPKGLVEVLGERMIERQIKQLHEAGITDITIVVGYLKEKFEYLIDKYDVKLLYNPEYLTKNNLSTYWHARDLFRGRNMYLLVSDNWIRNNMFHAYECASWYSSVYMEGPTSEWCLDINKKGRITDVRVGGRDAWVMYGPVCMLRSFTERFLPMAEADYLAPGTEQNYWEQTLVHHIEELSMDANCQPADQVYEFENLEELRNFDPRYQNHSDNRAMQLVSQVFHVRESEIQNIRCLKAGMTNQSFLFEVEGRHYICRVPGQGTEKLINRHQEHAVYAAVAGLAITEKVIYFNEDTGYKISEYYEGARNADFSDPESPEVASCMAIVRRLHQSGITVDHPFDIAERIDFYEGLCSHMQQNLFEDYDQVRARMDELIAALRKKNRPKVLAHIDAVCDNFLILPGSRTADDRAETADGKNGEMPKDIRLIDWEYAGMADPLLDIAMSSIYAYYDISQTDKLLSVYLERTPTAEEEAVTYAYAALGGFLWALWAVFKSMAGIEFGDYTIKMYRYAKEFYRKIMGEPMLKEALL